MGCNTWNIHLQGNYFPLMTEMKNYPIIILLIIKWYVELFLWKMINWNENHFWIFQEAYVPEFSQDLPWIFLDFFNKDRLFLIFIFYFHSSLPIILHVVHQFKRFSYRQFNAKIFRGIYLKHCDSQIYVEWELLLRKSESSDTNSRSTGHNSGSTNSMRYSVVKCKNSQAHPINETFY